MNLSQLQANMSQQQFGHTLADCMHVSNRYGTLRDHTRLLLMNHEVL